MPIRPLTAADVDAVAEVDFAACHEVALRRGMRPSVRAVRESRTLVRDLLAADPLGGFVAEEEGCVVGYAWLHARGPIAVVGPLAVEPAAQRRGLGRALLAHCLQAAGSRTTQVRLVHDGFDTGALELWMSEGFRVVAPVLELELPAGTAVPTGPPGTSVTIREATTTDHARIAARDARTFGAPRPKDVERLLRGGRGVIAERGRSMVGFALGGFGRLGPATADEPALVLTLLATLANDPAFRGDALRVTVVATDRALVDGLRGMGLRVVRTCLYMIRGGGTAPPAGYVLMGGHYA